MSHLRLARLDVNWQQPSNGCPKFFCKTYERPSAKSTTELRSDLIRLRWLHRFHLVRPFHEDDPVDEVEDEEQDGEEEERQVVQHFRRPEVAVQNPRGGTYESMEKIVNYYYYNVVQGMSDLYCSYFVDRGTFSNFQEHRLFLFFSHDNWYLYWDF